MSKTKIEWCDYTINPVKGLCPVACPYCYARRLYHRFGWKAEVRWDTDGYHKDDWGLAKITRPSRIFVGSTMELFGDWIPSAGMPVLFQVIRRYPQHTFIFLTKRPWDMVKWSPFPRNVWIGLSVDGTENAPFHRIYNGIENAKATVKFVSFEPLRAPITGIDPRDFKWAGIGWVIIGQQTPVNVKTAPKTGWVRMIVEAADKVGVPVFLKNNLAKGGVIDTSCDFAFSEKGYRQEFPARKVGALDGQAWLETECYRCAEYPKCGGHAIPDCMAEAQEKKNAIPQEVENGKER